MINVDDYQKSLCSEIFNSKFIQKYISKYCKNCVYGYLGHESRTHETDLILNNIYYSLILDSKQFKFKKRHFIKWICSKYARKFMNICDYCEDFECSIISEINLFAHYENKIKINLTKLRRNSKWN